MRTTPCSPTTASILIAGLGWACTPRYVPTGSATQPQPVAAAPAAVEPAPPVAAPDPSWDDCRLDVDCGLSEDPSEFAVCEASECVRWDVATMWSWATQHAPVLADLRAATALEDVPWIPESGGVRLFVDARRLIWAGKARCVPIDFAWHEGSLVADIPERLGTKPGTKNAWFYTLQLSGGVSVLGPGRITKGPEGEGAEAIGELQTFGHSLLVDDRALRYTGARFAAELECGDFKVERTHCEPRTCPGCTTIAVHKRSLEPRAGFGRAARATGRTTGGPCEPCPPDTLGPHLPRLKSAVVGRVFVEDLGDDAGPVFHRKQKDCVAALKKKRRR